MDESTRELRAIRAEMAGLLGRTMTAETDLTVIVAGLVGALCTLAYHVERLEKDLNG